MDDPIAMLKRDHREVEEMLRKLADSRPGARRRTAVQRLTAALQLHMDVEEKLLYPLVTEMVGAEQAEEAEMEHRLARVGLEQLQQLTDEPGFGAAVEMLRAGVKHHVREEEREVLPELKRNLDRAQLAEVGEQMVAMRAEAGRRGRKSPAKARKQTRKRTGTRRAGRKASARG